LEKNVDYKPAAVLIPFVKVDSKWHLLFIRRSKNDADPHSGQVAFAGGKREVIDKTIFDTALRETQEEIGIYPEHVTILGSLSPHYSISRFRITPVVAEVKWPYDFRLDEREVARVFTIPLEWLADSDNYQINHKKIGIENDQLTPVVYYKEYNGEILWGATARMTLSLLSVLEIVSSSASA